MFVTESLSIDDFRNAYRNGVITKDPHADLEEGSVYDVIGGWSALIWSRLTQRDTNVFNDIQTDTANGDALTTRLDKIFDIQRNVFQPGTGQVTIVRSSPGSADDTIWQGTTIELYSKTGGLLPSKFIVSSDTPVLASTLTVTLNISALQVGPEVSVFSSDSVLPRFSDSLQDNSWTISNLFCSAGQDFEESGAAVARARSTKRDKRVAHKKAIIKACKEAGANHVVLFPSNFGGDDIDYGLNMVYVDGNNNIDPIKLCDLVALKLEKFRAIGDCMQVRPIVNQNLVIKVSVLLYDSPAKINQQPLIQRIANYITSALDNDYSYNLDTLKAAVFQASPLIQDVLFTLPAADAPVIVNSNFPASLVKYNLNPSNITVTLKGPNA